MLISFLHALRYLYLLHQAIRIIIVKTTINKVNLLKLTLGRPILLPKYVKLSESALKKAILSLEYEALSRYLSNFV